MSDRQNPQNIALENLVRKKLWKQDFRQRNETKQVYWLEVAFLGCCLQDGGLGILQKGSYPALKNKPVTGLVSNEALSIKPPVLSICPKN